MANIILSHWDIIYKIIINTLIVSIPEEIYIVLLVLILAGEFDYWKEEECKYLINRWDYSRILIPSVPIALLSNILRYNNLKNGISTIILLFFFYILIIITNDVLKDANAINWISKNFIYFLIAIFSLGISEFLYLPLLLYYTGFNLPDINQNLLLNFLFSLPSRIMQYFVIMLLIKRKRNFKLKLQAHSKEINKWLI